MLLQLVAHHPEAVLPILRNTPAWVWGLLAALLALGLGQLRDRRIGRLRASLLPGAMTLFSASGLWSAFHASPHLPAAIGLWLLAAAAAFALVAPRRVAAHFDAATRTFHVAGSMVPLLLILGIFAVKYVVGVELAMAPGLVQDARYVGIVAALYGAFTGVFAGRSARLWRLALRARPAGAAA